MESIVLEVDDSTGKAYKNFNSATRQKFNTIISEFLKKAINDVQEDIKISDKSESKEEKK